MKGPWVGPRKSRWSLEIRRRHLEQHVPPLAREPFEFGSHTVGGAWPSHVVRCGNLLSSSFSESLGQPELQMPRQPCRGCVPWLALLGLGPIAPPGAVVLQPDGGGGLVWHPHAEFVRESAEMKVSDECPTHPELPLHGLEKQQLRVQWPGSHQMRVIGAVPQRGTVVRITGISDLARWLAFDR